MHRIVLWSSISLLLVTFLGFQCNAAEVAGAATEAPATNATAANATAGEPAVATNATTNATAPVVVVVAPVAPVIYAPVRYGYEYGSGYDNTYDGVNSGYDQSNNGYDQFTSGYGQYSTGYGYGQSNNDYNGDGSNNNQPGSNYGQSGNGYNQPGSNYPGRSGNDYYRPGNTFVQPGNGPRPAYNSRDYGISGRGEPITKVMDVWINIIEDWNKPDKTERRLGVKLPGPPPQNNYKNNNKKNYNNQNNYNQNNYNKDSKRKKRAPSQVRFPVKQYKDIRRFPIGLYPPFISAFPWLPIFYDKLTYQTFIFSPTGGMYILPPLINFYGQRFAVAQLIKWGYASLVSTGVPPAPGFNVAPLVQPAPPGGVVAGVVGSAGAGPGPTFNAAKGSFVGAVQTDFATFKPRYPKTLDTVEYVGRSDRPSYSRSYDSDNGGTRQQQVYDQGEQRSGGSYGGGNY